MVSNGTILLHPVKKGYLLHEGMGIEILLPHEKLLTVIDERFVSGSPAASWDEYLVLEKVLETDMPTWWVKK